MQLVAAQLAMRSSLKPGCEEFSMLYALNVKMPFELTSSPRDEVTFKEKGEAFRGFSIVLTFRAGSNQCIVPGARCLKPSKCCIS